MKIWMGLIAVLLASACGSAEDTAEEAGKGGVIGESYVESLEEAEAVEDLVLEQKQRVDEALEEAEGGD
ncbi:MAG: hypothetical protein AAFX56_13170 [Pseudomonadota bacterium]